MARFLKEPGPRMIELLKRAGDNDVAVAAQGRHELAKALELPLRKGMLRGDITGDIFEEEFLQPGVTAEYPLDLLTPGTEDEYTAYTIPAQGRIPEMHVQGDYVMVPTFEVGTSIDFATKYARDARWNVLGRAMQVMEGSVVRKKNSDAWRTIITAGYNRFLNVYDDKVIPGFFSKRLVELMKTVMRRQAGGNSTSVNRGKLERLYTSPEALGDIRTWDNTQVDPFTRRDLYVADDLDQINIFGVNIRAIDELGFGQEFQTYYDTTLGATMPTYSIGGASQTKLEIIVGLDLSHEGTFMNPVRQAFQIQEDDTFKRQRRISMWGYLEHGFMASDSRRVLVGSI